MLPTRLDWVLPLGSTDPVDRVVVVVIVPRDVAGCANMKASVEDKDETIKTIAATAGNSPIRKDLLLVLHRSLYRGIRS